MPDYRAALGALMDETVRDEAAHGDWTYDDSRPCEVEATWWPGKKVRSDCSKGVQKLCRWAGIPAAYDPMGMWYGPYGNSATLAVHLPHLASVSQLQVGDIITFGPGGDEHAAMVRNPGADPLLWGDGHQGAPVFNPLSWDHREHQLLRLVLPDWQPSPEDKLRAETGYWAWVAWNYGEGDWRHYGPRNKTVRPSVPARIPAAWKRALAKFDRNRHKGDKGPTSPARAQEA